MTDFTIGTLRRDDFVLLTDDIKCWIVEIEDISLLEARQNFTLGDAILAQGRQEQDFFSSSLVETLLDQFSPCHARHPR